MLVLSRERDQTIIIGDEVEITIVDVRGDKVRLGITAPSRIAVHRKEVYEAIRRENAQASCVDRSAIADHQAKTPRVSRGARPARLPGIAVPLSTTPGRITPAAPGEPRRTNTDATDPQGLNHGG